MRAGSRFARDIGRVTETVHARRPVIAGSQIIDRDVVASAALKREDFGATSADWGNAGDLSHAQTRGARAAVYAERQAKLHGGAVFRRLAAVRAASRVHALIDLVVVVGSVPIRVRQGGIGGVALLPKVVQTIAVPVLERVHRAVAITVGQLRVQIHRRVIDLETIGQSVLVGIGPVRKRPREYAV